MQELFNKVTFIKEIEREPSQVAPGQLCRANWVIIRSRNDDSKGLFLCFMLFAFSVLVICRAVRIKLLKSQEKKNTLSGETLQGR